MSAVIPELRKHVLIRVRQLRSTISEPGELCKEPALALPPQQPVMSVVAAMTQLPHPDRSEFTSIPSSRRFAWGSSGTEPAP